MDAFKKQILRLSGLLYYPAEDMAVKSLVESLREHTASEQHAVATIDAVLEDFERCPTPAELRRIAFETRPPAPATHVGCRLCRGTGWVHKVVGVYEGSERCPGEQAELHLAKPSAGISN